MSVVLRLRNPEIDDEQVDRQTQTDRGLAEESVLLQQTLSRTQDYLWESCWSRAKIHGCAQL